MSLAFGNMIINFYSILVLIVIYYHSVKHTFEASMQSRLYNMMLQSAIVLLIVDTLGRCEGYPHTFLPYIGRVGNYLITVLSPLLPSLWLLYVHYQIFNDDNQTKRLIPYLLALNFVHVAIGTLSEHYNWIYFIDEVNIYHRGPYYYIASFLSIMLLLAAFTLILINRKRIDQRCFSSLMWFAAPPFFCYFLQIYLFGYSLIVNSAVVSLLVIFFNIQSRSMRTDYLTGVNNRKKLEEYLKDKISESTVNRTFGAIFLDLNNFKSINDTFGHDIGDRALESFAKLLRSCVRSSDLVARFGGDEFYIVLNITDQESLEATAHRINDRIREFNQSGDQPYMLDFSMGYAVYDRDSGMGVQEFQRLVDSLMYENKNLWMSGVDNS